MVAITKRKDGRFVAKVTIDGRRHCVYGRSEAEVRSKLEELERQLLLGQPPVPGRLTVAQWLEAWYEAERSRWRPRTAHDYRKLLDTLILPRIGRVRLSAMSPLRWQRFFDSFSGRTATLVFSIIRRAGVCATRWRWLPENPAKLVVPPHHRPRRIELPGRDALVRLAEHCRTSADPGAPLVLFVLCTGLRLGEVAALRWGISTGKRVSSTCSVLASGSAVAGWRRRRRRRLVVGQSSSANSPSKRCVASMSRSPGGVSRLDRRGGTTSSSPAGRAANRSRRSTPASCSVDSVVQQVSHGCTSICCGTLMPRSHSSAVRRSLTSAHGSATRRRTSRSASTRMHSAAAGRSP
jgi:hypothetical protein